MIRFENINKAFKKKTVFNNLDLKLEKSGITALIGPNGSGKTTLIKCFLGLCIPDSGNILFEGSSVIHEYAFRRNVSYLPQIARFPENLTGLELITMIREIKPGANRTDELIEIFEFKPELEKKIATLSGGFRQKLNLILCLMYDNPVIILDEPSNGLDPIALLQLKAFLNKEKKRNKMIVLTTHIMSLVEEIATDIVFLLDGHAYYQGSLNDLLLGHESSSLEKAIAVILKKHKSLKDVESV